VKARLTPGMLGCWLCGGQCRRGAGARGRRPAVPGQSGVVRNLDGMPDGHSGRVRQYLRHDLCCFQTGRRVPMLSGRRPYPPTWTRPWPAMAAVPGSCPAARHASCHVRGATTGTITCPHWWPAGERWPDIRSEHQIAADTSMVTDTSVATCAGYSPSGRRSFREQRTVNPLIALCK
jgi:hypothetical protein